MIYQVINAYLTQAGGTTITVPSGKVGSNLTNFVTMLDLSHLSATFWDNVSSDGGNIRVKQGGSVIPFDLTGFDAGTDTGRIFFRATLNSGSDNVFTVELDGSGLLAATDPNGRNDVWQDYDYAAIFDGTTTNRNANTFTITGSHLSPLVHPQFIRFNGSTRIWDGMPARRTTYTFGMSFYRTGDTGALSDGLITYNSATSTDRHTLAIRELGTTDSIGLWNPTDSWHQPTTIAGGLNTLFRAVATQTSTTNRKLYLNGALQGTDTTVTATPTLSTTGQIRIGAPAGNSEALVGEVGYAYLRNGELSADWLAAEYESWHSPATFYTVS